MKLGRLERIDPRMAWPHEAHDMTPWLLNNSDVLADVLGIDLELNGAEHAVGAFSLDLIGRDLTHDCVLIVENQLTTTDHGHLGQLITYAAGTEAGTVVWVAPAFREEHREALALLNTLGGDRVRFFGIQLSAVRIGQSDAAPLLELQAQPNDWATQVAATAQAASHTSGKPTAYGSFWVQMLERIRAEHPDWTKARRPGPVNWLAMRSPFRGEGSYSLVFCQGNQIRSELYIDHRDPERVTAIFTALERRKHAIEEIYGEPLQWEQLPSRRASRIAAYTDGDVLDTDRHEEFITWFLNAQVRLRRAIDHVIPQVRAELDTPTPEDPAVADTPTNDERLDATVTS
jgi:hypothetical protein